MFNKYFPDFYYNRVDLIPIDLFLNNNIKLVIFDLDNTLVDFTYRLNPKIKNWISKLQSHGIKCQILSNSKQEKYVSNIAKKIDLRYICDAKKPNLIGFEKILKENNIPKENIMIIGDQIFTDIVGGKNFGIKTLLVEPINFIEVPVCLLKRPMEVPIKIAYHCKRKKLNNFKN